MKIKILFALLFSLIEKQVLSQSVLDNITKKEDPQTRQVVPYPYLREADVMWTKRVWRLIDLNEKINLPLRYPNSKESSDRKNLIDVLMDAIENGKLTAYSYVDDEFTLPITYSEIEARGGARIDTIDMPSPEPPYTPARLPVKRDFSRDKVIGYRLKEDWFFDSRSSIMDVRIIGIAPVIYAFDEAGNIREGNIQMPLFWVYYPDARKLLTNAEVYIRQNNNLPLSFDDVFQKRFFNSYIYKESNVYDRRIEDYKSGLNALLESENIKDEITNFEHDMWEF